MAARPIPFLGPMTIVPGALASALLAGIATAVSVPLGVGLVTALCYGPLVLINLPLGLALWVALVFVEHLPATSIGPNAGAILILLAWFGTLTTRRGEVVSILRRHRGIVAGVVGLLLWVTVSIAWAPSAAAGGADLWQWYVAALVLLVVATTSATSIKAARLVAGAFVAGAVVSVLVGLAGGALESSGTAVDSATQFEGRLQGGGGDPNYLAAGLVPAIVLAAGLASGNRSPVLRWLLGGSIGLLTVGLAATQSRGGMIAAAAAVLAAFTLSKGHRAHMLVCLAVALGAGGAWLATSPDALERVTDFDGGGTGRSDLWRVAWRMVEDHPVAGIGLGNFREEASRYVRDPGALEFVELIAERPHVAHNAYLQLFAETGLVGLALFLGLLAACMRAALLAARRFDLAGNEPLAALARAVLVATIGALTASIFISNAPDKRTWMLLALGPGLLALALRTAPREQLAAPEARP